MPVGSSSDWQNAWADVPLVANTSWKANLALYLDDMTSGLLVLSGIFASPGTGAGVFTFNVAAFQGGLSGNGASVLANAWETALNASSFTVAPGAFVGSDTPATKFSVVASAIFDPASIALGKAKILTLPTIPPVSDVLSSQFGVVMREAFLLLTVTVIGTNSVVPPAGPNPLTAAAGAVS